jgi:acetyl-CoA carboxylase carboxyltransferase component
MTDGSGLYLAGPALVKSAIGQDVTSEELGGALMHASISGTIDFREPDEESCLVRLRKLAETLPEDARNERFRWEESTPPARPVEDLYEVVSPDPQSNYEARDMLECLVDAGSFQEYKAEYGRSLVCGYARIGGFSVGVLINQHHAEKTGEGSLEVGGVIYHDSADKAARFVLDCNQTWTPLVFLQDVYGFMVGRDSEQRGIIRAGAKLVNAISNSRVPKVTVITGGSFGAGNYAMCGKAFDPRFIFAWPNARYAVMGAAQASQTLFDVSLAALRRSGEEPEADELEAYRDKVHAAYEEQTKIDYAAARGWVDEVILPHETRNTLITALEAATRHAEEELWRTGVWQV